MAQDILSQSQFTNHSPNDVYACIADQCVISDQAKSSINSLKKRQKQRIEPRWRSKAVKYLRAAGYDREADLFAVCGDLERGFHVDICQAHPVTHTPRAIPETCHLRICPECEHRAQALRLQRYIPAIESSCALNVPGYSLKKFELTTPFQLGVISAGIYRQMWIAVIKTINRALFLELTRRDNLCAAEIKRGRVDLKKHNIGVLITAEFGERGQKLHFHVLIYSCFIEKDTLTRCWHDATGGQAKITWIKRIDRGEIVEAVKEVTKYVTKFTSLPARLVPELLKVLEGSRRVRTLGAWYGLPPIEKESCTCSECGASRRIVTLDTFLEIADHDDQHASLVARDRYGKMFLLDLRHGNKFGEKPQLVITPVESVTQLELWSHKPRDSHSPPGARESIFAKD